MKKKKKLLSLLMAVCVLLSMFPLSGISASAENGVLTGDGTEGSPYIITDAADLKAFRDLVNGGQRSISARLEKDIDLNPGYTFHSDGTYTGGEAPEQWNGIWKYSGTFDGNGHTISGIYIDGNDDFVGLFRQTNNCTLKNLGVINSYISGTNWVGGIVAMTRGIIENCYNTGTVKGADHAGGIVGETYSQVINCFNTGSISAQYGRGGITGTENTSTTITNCYYLSVKTYGNRLGTLKTAEEFASGEVAYLLNGSSSVSPVWYQTIGTDSYPVVDSAHGTVYYGYVSCITGYSNSADKVHEAPLAHQFENGVCKVCKAGQTGPLVTEDNYEELGLTEDFIGYYAISTAEELKGFRDMANGGMTSANGVLLADIDLNPGYTFHSDGIYTGGDAPEQWTPIGSMNNRYTGTFDGNNKTIRGLYISNSSFDQGLFGYIGSKGSVKNLNISNSLISAQRLAGSIAGRTSGATIENCSNSVYLRGTMDIGGIVGSSTSSLIQYCSNSGDVYAETEAVGGIAGASTYSQISYCSNSGNVSTKKHAGGIAGFSHDSTYSNCFNVGKVSAIDRVFGTAEKPVNCYYLDSCLSGSSYSDGGTAKNQSQFASGEVAYLLNGSSESPVWYQTLGTDAYPVLDSTHGTVYYGYTSCIDTAYSNNSSAVSDTPLAHQFENGVCKVCGAGQTGPLVTEDSYEELGLTEDYIGYYAISNADELNGFRDMANSGMCSANGVLISDIILNDDFDQSKFSVNDEGKLTYDGSADIPDFETWNPIFSYAGTFDGNGHSVSGIYINNSENNQGLFGSLSAGGIVKNVDVINSCVSAQAYVGGVAGAVSGSNAKIENCTNAGLVIGDQYVGGVVGSLEQSGCVASCINTGMVNGNDAIGGVVGNASRNITIEKCFNTGKISGNSRVGGVAGNADSDGSVSNCFNTATVNGESRIGGVAGHVSQVQVNNCYYLKALDEDTIPGIGDGSGEAQPKTAQQFASGEVAYLLNGSSSVSPEWYQTIGTDAHPVFDSTHGIIYFGYTSCVDTAYSNNASALSKTPLAHKYSEWIHDENASTHSKVCSVCNDKVTENCVGGTATYFKKAVCTVCNGEYGNFLADATAPTGEITLGTNSWKEFLNTITFGLFFKDTQSAEITASDDSYSHSGYTEDKAVKVEYYLHNGDNALSKEELANASFTEYTGSLSLNPDNKYVIYVKLTDWAGNVTYISSDGIVLDATAPSVSGIENGKTYCISAQFTVSDEYLASVSANGTELTPDSNGVYTLSAGEYAITATDKSNNSVTLNVTVNEQHTPKADDGDCSTTIYCTVCNEITTAAKAHDFSGAWKSDENGHWHICLNENCTVTDEVAAHTADEDGDCTTETLCKECGYVVTEAQPEHSFTEWESTGEGTHERKCTIDVCTVSETENCYGGTSTCTEGAICSVCGAVYEDALGHTLEKTEAKDPTCTEAGNVEYWHCTVCGKYFADEKAENEIILKDTEVAPAGHQYENGKCTVCGEKDPSYTAPSNKDTSLKSPETGSHFAVSSAGAVLFCAAAIVLLKKRRDTINQ